MRLVCVTLYRGMQPCTQHAILTAASAIGKSNGDIRARMVDNIVNSLMATARREEGLTIKLKMVNFS